MGQVLTGLESKKIRLYPVDNGSQEILSRYVGRVRFVLYKGYSGDALARSKTRCTKVSEK